MTAELKRDQPIEELDLGVPEEVIEGSTYLSNLAKIIRNRHARGLKTPGLLNDLRAAYQRSYQQEVVLSDCPDQEATEEVDPSAHTPNTTDSDSLVTMYPYGTRALSVAKGTSPIGLAVSVGNTAPEPTSFEMFPRVGIDYPKS